MRASKKIKVIGCADCGQHYLSSYAFKRHVCGTKTGYASRDEALARIREERAHG